MKKLFLLVCLTTQFVSCDQLKKIETETETKTVTKTKTNTVVEEKHYVHLVTEQEALELRESASILDEEIKEIEKDLDSNLLTVSDIDSYNSKLVNLRNIMLKLEKYAKGLTLDDQNFTEDDQFSIAGFLSSNELSDKIRTKPVYISEDFVDAKSTRRFGMSVSGRFDPNDYNSSYGFYDLGDVLSSLNNNYNISLKEYNIYEDALKFLTSKFETKNKVCKSVAVSLQHSRQIYLVENEVFNSEDISKTSTVFKLKDHRLQDFKDNIFKSIKDCVEEKLIPKKYRPDYYSTTDYIYAVNSFNEKKNEIKRILKEVKEEL